MDTKVELRDEDLKQVAGGTEEFDFQEAEDLSLGSKETKELRKDNRPEKKPETDF